MHIAIEGFDGVGKTTICTLLANKLHFTFVEKPLHYLFDSPDQFDNYIRIRDYVNQQDNRIFTSWFYGLGNVFLYNRFADDNIITDRHLVSNYLWSGTDRSKLVFDTLVDLIGSPDYTFLLYADKKNIEQRIRQRDQNDPDMNKLHQVDEAYDKMEQFLQQYNMEYTQIDTSNMDPSVVVQMIMDTLRDLQIITSEGDLDD